MENFYFIILLFLLEIIVDVCVLKILKISYTKSNLLFLQTPKICVNIVNLFLIHTIYIQFLVKFVSVLLCIIFLTDSLKLKKLLSFLFLEYIIFFSIAGFFSFITLWIFSSVEQVFLIKMSIFQQNIAIFLIFIYIFAFYFMVRRFESYKFNKHFAAKVSFFLNNKHINLYGLIDSGNHLYDTLTKLPVVLVSYKSLKKYFNLEEFDCLLRNNFRKIKCETMFGSGYEIPIFKVKNFRAKFNDEIKCFCCMVGIVDYSFRKGRFECLLHGDIL